MRPSESLNDPQALESLVLRWVWLLVAGLIAIVIGYWIGVQDIFKLAIVAGVAVFITIATLMRDRAWVLIPLGWALTGTSSFLPLRISIRDLCILLAFCSCVTYAIVAQRSYRRKWNVFDTILAVNLAWLVFTFIHHPVGLLVFGTETVGARPYIEILLAVTAYWVITRFPNSVKATSRIPYFVLTGTTIVAVINLTVYIAPALTPIVHYFYQGVDIGSYLALGVAEQTIVARWEQFAPLGVDLIFLLCALYPPRTLFNPLRPRSYVFALGLVAILVSGYRNNLLWALVALGLGSWFQRGWREVWMGALAGALMLGALVLGQGRLYQLPNSAQRTLSWLPGDWSKAVAAEAQQSSESRFQWWRNVIKYNLIHDWWLGDGFGVKVSDYTLFQSSRDFVGWMTLVGGYHNGPLTSIRYTGIIGLIFFYILMFTAAVYSVKEVNRCRGTPLQTVAIFLAIQLVWEPIHFTFVFGDYDNQLCQTIFLVASLLIIMRMRDQLPAESDAAAVRPASSALALAVGTAP